MKYRTIRFYCYVPAVYRGNWRRGLKQFCHSRGIELYMQEDKGIFKSLFYGEIEGDKTFDWEEIDSILLTEFGIE